MLAPYREQARLRSIGVHGDPRHTEVPQLEISTHDNTRITWGSAPGSELPGELTVQMKLNKLLSDLPMNSSDLRMASPVGGQHR